MQKLKIQNKEQIREQIHLYLHKNEEARFIHRLHGVLLLIDNEQNNCTTVGSLFKNSPRSLSNWVYKINNSNNIEILRDRPKPGKKPRLTDDQMEKIKVAIQKHPEEVGISANIWDGKVLSFYIQKEFGVILLVRQCQRLFKKLGFSLKRARPVVAKGNPQLKEESKKT